MSETLCEIEPGANSAEEDFLKVAAFILENCTSFSEADFFTNSKALAIPPREISKLFTSWARKKQFEGKIYPVFGCYDTPVYNIL